VKKHQRCKGWGVDGALRQKKMGRRQIECLQAWGTHERANQNLLGQKHQRGRLCVKEIVNEGSRNTEQTMWVILSNNRAREKNSASNQKGICKKGTRKQADM